MEDYDNDLRKGLIYSLVSEWQYGKCEQRVSQDLCSFLDTYPKFNITKTYRIFCIKLEVWLYFNNFDRIDFRITKMCLYT